MGLHAFGAAVGIVIVSSAQVLGHGLLSIAGCCNYIALRSGMNAGAELHWQLPSAAFCNSLFCKHCKSFSSIGVLHAKRSLQLQHLNLMNAGEAVACVTLEGCRSSKPPECRNLDTHALRVIIAMDSCAVGTAMQ